MIVTLTSKGQLTLPKAIRDQMNLDAGSKLDFQVQPDGTLAARPMNRSVESLFGMFHRPGREAVSIAQMKKDRDDALAADDARIRLQTAKRHRAEKKGA